MKNKFSLPIIMLTDPTPTPGNGGVIGGGTGQSGTDPLNPYNSPLSFAAWKTSEFWSDYDSFYGNDNNTPDFEEYCMWWLDNNFTIEQWTAVGNNATEFPGNN